jgi:hypothetical protein
MTELASSTPRYLERHVHVRAQVSTSEFITPLPVIDIEIIIRYSPLQGKQRSAG